MSSRLASVVLSVSVTLLAGCSRSHVRLSADDDSAGAPGAVDSGAVGDSLDAGQGWPAELRDASAQEGGLGDSGQADAGWNHATAFVPAPNRTDMAHDAKRGILYITSTEELTSESSLTAGSVLRWDLNTRTFLDPLLEGGAFLGIDLSPDEDTLVVADANQNQTDKVNWVHLIDLKTGNGRKIEFPLDDGEGGTFMPIFLDAHTLLVSSRYNGSGWVPLRKVDLDDDTVTVVDSVRLNSMLALSADRSTVGIAQSDDSGGPLDRYDLVSGKITEVSEECFLYEVAVSRDGSQLAAPSCLGTKVYDGALNLLVTLGASGNAGAAPVATVYSPVSDVMYVAWDNSDWLEETNQPSLDAYSTKTLKPIATIEPATSLFRGNGNYAFVSGRLRISRDGKLLFASVDGGIAVYDVGEGLQPTP